MLKNINNKIFLYILIFFSVYITAFMVFAQLYNGSTLMNLLYFINEDVLEINLLISLSLLIDYLIFKRFIYIAIIFKSLSCVYNILNIFGLSIDDWILEIACGFYWLITLFLLYGSSKRLFE